MIWGGRRRLSAGHCIDKVVNTDYFQIDIASRCVDQVIAADRGKISIPGVDNYIQLGVRQLKPSCKRNGASVRGMKRIQLHVAGNAAGAPDARDQGQGSQVDLRMDKRPRE